MDAARRTQQRGVRSELADYDEAIRLEPKAVYYRDRGLTWSAKRNYDKAIADDTEAIRLDPKYVVAYID